MQFTDYTQTCEYLFQQLPMFTRIGAAAYKKDLTNTRLLCKLLNEPQNGFKSIHIAGTNGKGSTSHMLAAILQAAGYKTGLYTSPHLKDFRERIRINGELIPEQKVVDFVNTYQADFEPIAPSFFEWTVALAFQYFSEQKVDIAVIETGLGGRLDSTNIIQPILSVITNIGWDHMDMLGDTLPKIAGEKAGIIKAHTPIVIGEYHTETAPVFLQKAALEKAPIVFAKDILKVERFSTLDAGKSECDIVFNSSKAWKKIELQLGGIYQQHNVATVLTAVEYLTPLGFSIPESAIRKGLAEVNTLTGLKGRWQMLSTHPRILCDTAHNINGIAMVVDQLTRMSYDTLHMVIGMVRDKEIDKILETLPKQAIYYFTQASLPRALPSNELAEKAHQVGLFGNTYPTVADALAAAKSVAQPHDLIFVGGSTFVVAEIC